MLANIIFSFALPIMPPPPLADSHPKPTENAVRLYTDGAASGNPGPGGYGAILQWRGHERELSAGFRHTTNNRMELMAVIEGLEALNKPGRTVHIWSDSRYVVDSVEKGWLFNWEKKAFKAKKNPDLWRRFLLIFRQHKVRLHWIKGHNDHPLNERCDELAVAASKSPSLIDTGYEES